METENLLTHDVALSFAGEDREFVEQIAKGLRVQGLSVFYDGYEEANLWGKDLYVHLTKVYRDDSKYCLMFISDSYSKKQWTNHERKAAQARAFMEKQEYILPLRLDDVCIDGILDTTGYIDARHKTVEEIVNLVSTKVRTFNEANGIKAEIVKVEDVFEKAGIEFPNGQNVKDSMMITSCPTCGEKQLLSGAIITLKGEDTAYECKNGCQVIAVVGRPVLQAWQGRGYRLKDYVIRNSRDIVLKLNLNHPGGLVIPASPAALMSRKANGS